MLTNIHIYFHTFYSNSTYLLSMYVCLFPAGVRVRNAFTAISARICRRLRRRCVCKRTISFYLLAVSTVFCPLTPALLRILCVVGHDLWYIPCAIKSRVGKCELKAMETIIHTAKHMLKYFLNVKRRLSSLQWKNFLK